MENKERNEIELSRLVAVLEKVLHATNRTTKLLHESSDEAQNLLSNWHIPGTSICEELPHCTCDDKDEGEGEDSSEITGVVKDIEQVVEQAQKLRGTLSASKPEAKDLLLTKIPKTAKISQLGFTSKNLNYNVPKKPQSTKFSYFNKPLTTGNGCLKGSINSSVAKRSSLDNRSPRTIQTNANRRSIPVAVLNGNCGKKAATKPRFKPGSPLQSTYRKDFSVRTNCSTAKYKTARGCVSKPKESSEKDEGTANNTNASYGKDVERDTNKSSTTFSEKLAVSDLEDLLSRVTVYPNASVNPDIKKNKLPQVKLNSCLLHGDKTVHIAKSSYRAVKLAEAVDTLGVPSDLVTVLKTYHSFFQERQRRKKRGSDAVKGQVAAGSFLNKLSSMNDASWNKFAYEPVVELLVEYTALLSEVSRLMECRFKNKNDGIPAGLWKKYECLEKRYRKCSNIHESVFTQPNARNCNGSITEDDYKHSTPQDGCALIGIWNFNSRERFKALEEFQYIRYNSEVQWKKFEENVQEIQMLEFQTEVFEVLELHILPQLSTYSSQEPTFPKLYRTVCSLCNLARLTSPLIIKPC